MRLIDADKLKEAFAVPCYEAFSTTAICSIINDAPTVDTCADCQHGLYGVTWGGKNIVRVYIKGADDEIKIFEPVKHGKWKHHGRNLGECSSCGEIVNIRYNYCPNCGAKMQGEKDDE